MNKGRPLEPALNCNGRAGPCPRSSASLRPQRPGRSGTGAPENRINNYCSQFVSISCIPPPALAPILQSRV